MRERESLIRLDRTRGMRFSEIGEKYGFSRQYAHAVCRRVVKPKKKEKSKIKKMVEIIDGQEIAYYIQTNIGRYISGTRDIRRFDCLKCAKQAIGEDDRCNNYINHPDSWGICLNFMPESSERGE